jgi:hypothetical protein
MEMNVERNESNENVKETFIITEYGRSKATRD